VAVAAVWAVGIIAGPPARAANSPAVPGPKSADGKTTEPEPVNLPRQPGDDVLRPLVPAKPRTAGEQSRLDALAWYMTGQLREQRNDFTGALDAYKKAVELDPEAVDVYRALVPLAFSLNQDEDAVRYGLKAVELDPDDYELLRRIGIHLATEREIERALKLLEMAVQSKSLEHNSSAFVMLNRDLSILYSALGQAEKAADAYEVVFEARQDPKKFNLEFRLRRALESDAASSYERIGQAFLDAGRTELAVKAFEEAAEDARGNPGQLAFNLARVYLKDDQPEKALEQLQKYFDAQLQSKGREAYELLADILEELEREGELIGRLEKLAENDNRNQTLQFFLAEQYLEANRLDDAARLYKTALEDNKDAEGYAGLASVYRRQNKPTELFDSLVAAAEAGAVESAEITADEVEAIGRDEKLLESVLKVAENRAADKNLDFAGTIVAGRLASAGKRTEAAVEFYEQALTAGRDKADEIYAELGEYLFEQEAYAEASRWFQRASDDPIVAGSKANWLFRLSQARTLNGETDAALKAVREAQNLLPNVPLLHFQEGWIYYYAQQYDEALKRFEDFEKRFPQDTDTVRRAQFIVSNIYVQRGDLRKGEEVLERVLAQSPDDPSVNNDLGYLYADHGKNLEKAKSMIEKALKAEPENPAYLDSMGWVLYKLGEHEQALKYLKQAVEAEDGGDSTIWDHYGDVLLKSGRTTEAVDAWKKALEVAKKDTRPDEKLIQRIEEKLQSAKEDDGDDS
jgi:tetratricopeptide (TPR) repeat protein